MSYNMGGEIVREEKCPWGICMAEYIQEEMS